MNKAIEIAVVVLIGVLAASGIVWAVVFPSFTSMILFAGAFLQILIIFSLIDRAGINENYKLFVLIASIVGIAGEVYLFDNFFYYDKVIHFVDAIFLTLAVYDYVGRKGKAGFFAFILTFMAVVGFFGLWEMFEYAEDIIIGTHAQGVFDSAGNILMSKIDDTMIDMIIGSVSVLMVLNFKILKR